MDESTNNKKRPKIRSIETGFEILNSFCKEKPLLSLSELSLLTGYHKSQLYRYLNTFEELGILIKKNDGENYPVWSLGPTLIVLGEFAFSAMDITKEAKPYISMLRNKLNETVALSIWKEEPLFVYWEKSKRLINISLDTGSSVPLYSATGKIYRAFLPEDITNSLYKKEINNGKINKETFDSIVEDVKRNNFSTTTSSLLSGITALSVPIFSRGGRLAGALSILGVQGRIDGSIHSVNATELKRVSSEISRKLGYQGKI